ncbi:MAG: hypothetical protein ACO2PL_04080 [Armatimonadota bacterium]
MTERKCGGWRIASSEQFFWRVVLLHCRENFSADNRTLNSALRTWVRFTERLSFQTPNEFFGVLPTRRNG